MVKENGMIMISEEEYNKIIRQRNSYRRYVYNLLDKRSSSRSEDIEVSRQDFVDIYLAAITEMFDREEKDENYEDSVIYGNDVTIHWNGIYCNCEDGATIYNCLIPGIEAVISEID